MQFILILFFVCSTFFASRSDAQDASACSATLTDLFRHADDQGIVIQDGATPDVDGFAKAYLGGDEGLRFINRHSDLFKGVSPASFRTFFDARCHEGADALFPHNPTYRNLLDAYKHLRQRAEQSSKDPAFTLTKTLKVGMEDPLVSDVRRYLNFYGYKGGAQTSRVYDQGLEVAVKQFQMHHHENPDGVIGPKTQAMLRYTLDQRLNFVRTNMARWRALCLAHDELNKRPTDPLGERYFLINVADYHLCAVENDACALSMKTIVGQPSRKTPLFHSTMQRMIFNPTWTIPGGILLKDKVPRMMRDPGYAAKIASLTGVDPYSVDWHDPSARPSITYPPGQGNPLGRIKFFVVNNQAIYLHDTDQPELFKKSARALSSGCVRLEKPLELAAWLDKNGPYDTQEKIETFLKGTRTTTSHVIDPQVPCYFIYLTTGMSDDGFVWYSDPYGYDKA